MKSFLHFKLRGSQWRVLATIGMLLGVLNADAAEVLVDGIRYYLNSSNMRAEVIMPEGGYPYTMADVVLPENVTFEGEEYAVTHIGMNAFKDATELKSISLPSSLLVIGESAFENCTGLTSIEIPEATTAVEKYAFRRCENLSAFEGPYASADKRCLIYGQFLVAFAPAGLTSYSIPETVTMIGDGAFNECRALMSIEIPASVTTIGSYAFGYCTGLESLKLPDTLLMIDVWAFTYCMGLKDVEVPDSVLYIGGGTFEGCENLESIKFPAGLQYIEYSTLLGCEKLKSFEIPATVTHIGNGAFADCKSLTSMNIPESVISIASGSFHGCRNMQSFSGKFATADGRCLIADGQLVAFAPYGLDKYNFPESITSIGDYAAFDCNGPKRLRIPDTVTSIGLQAFYRCRSLQSVVIGSAVETIGDSAFESCTSLFEVYCSAMVPPVCQYGNAFAGVNKQECKLYVEAEALEDYKEARVWKDFLHIEPFDFAAGIAEVATAGSFDGTYRVYGLDGVLRLATTDKAALNALPAGIYIVNGVKIRK